MMNCQTEENRSNSFKSDLSTSPTTPSSLSKTAIHQDPSKINSSSLSLVQKLGLIFDLEHQLAFYGQYHVNKINVLIHIICVPLIFFTSLVLTHGASYFPSTVLQHQPIRIPELLLNTGLYGSDPIFELNLSTIVSVAYAIYFIILDPIAGTLYAPFLVSMGHWSNQLYSLSNLTLELPFLGLQTLSVQHLALGLFIFGWLAQFVGHGRFEGRAPALVDNLLQAIVLAVFFVFIELLFLLGYRPSLQLRLKHRVTKALLEYKRLRNRS